MDFSSVAQLGAKALVVAPTAPQPQPVEVRKVDEKSGAQGAGTDAKGYPGQDEQASASRDIIALREAVARGQRPAGPPPSFEVSILEVESDLQQKLARMEAERSNARNADAIRETAQADASEAEAAAEAVEAKAEAAAQEVEASLQAAEDTNTDTTQSES